jgi:PBP1b-binding outer membrane lipoprotein LpoB
MKSTRLSLIIAALITAGCATSLAPSDNFNDWTNSASYRPYQEPRSTVAVTAPHVDDDGTAGE